ncbi:MAG: hypothetical protein PHO05_02505 [bacterium]|nr:hypothetical protein [bacterium]
MEDALSAIWPNFGPGIIAAFLGAVFERGEETCWFLPAKDEDIADIHFGYDSGNIWLKCVRELYQAALVY